MTQNMTTETSFGTIKVQRVLNPEKSFVITLTFTDYEEYDATHTILEGIKEVQIVSARWGAAIHDRRKAIEDVKFWLLDRAA